MRTFGENLKEIRLEKRISQKNFAVLLQTSQQRISEWETNKVEPTLYNLIKITKILNVTFEELIEGI